MTPMRFWAAAALFHVIVLAAVWRTSSAWRGAARCATPLLWWLGTLARDVLILAVFAYAVSLLAPVAFNLEDLRRLRVGPISGRLMGQFLFGDLILLGAVLAFHHRRAGRGARALGLAALAACLLGTYVRAYHVEPGLLRVRHHEVTAQRGRPGPSLRILHLTDLQTPVIGPREEHALRSGLDSRPDLIVLTGDYVQDALGRPTEQAAAADLRALVRRIGFDAPLGVFATDGDVGPPCRDVFAGTWVRCLVDEGAAVGLPGGERLVITGLSRGAGRERDPAWLARLFARGPAGDYRVVISHAPDFVDALPEPVDLALAGHTHGGQVVLPLFGPPKTASRLPRRYAGGLNDHRGTPLHVSRGVGMERGFDIPVRFLCPPEICVLDVRLGRPVAQRSSRDAPAEERARAVSTS
jgi:hypothetical protein